MSVNKHSNCKTLYTFVEVYLFVFKKKTHDYSMLCSIVIIY